MTLDPRRLPTRPALSAPPADRPAASPVPGRWRRQPLLGLAGLLLVLPNAALLALGSGSAERSLLVLGPVVSFALPIIAMIAFWWEDWPGTLLRARWSGWVDTGLVAVAAFSLTVLGQAATGTVDLPTMLEFSPGPDLEPTSSALMPLAGAAFVTMLQLTLVFEGWPLRRLPRLPAGVLAVGVSWLVALALYTLLLGGRPFTGHGSQEGQALLSDGLFSALLTVISAWQVLIFLVWRGWPVTGIAQRGVRLLAGNTLVLGGAALTVAVLLGPFQMVTPRITATASCVVAAGFVVGMLLEGAGNGRGSMPRQRAGALALVLGGTALLDLMLASYGVGLDWRRGTDEEWVTHAGNAIAVSVILHVAIGRRWPFAWRRKTPGAS